jgi:hypothetical protein
MSEERCSIASVVYGIDAPETETFRAFRDEILLRSRAGTILVALYYMLAPYVARWLDG